MSEDDGLLGIIVLVCVSFGFLLFFAGSIVIGIGLFLVGLIASLPLMGRNDPPERESVPQPSHGTATDEALATLRTRYARGELSEEQFERKLERLLETETVEDAEALVDRRDESDPAFEDHGQ